MRRPFRFLLLALCCSLALSAQAQSPKPQASRAPSAKATASPAKPAASASAAPQASTTAARPQFRPAVLASGRDSLVNQMNVDELLKKGQKDGAVQFAVLVNPDGSSEDFVTYHALPNCDALENELQRQLETAKFTPPIFEHQPVKALLAGTVLFDADDAPHLRIVLNQDPREIEAGNDFIAPQPIIGADSKFTGLHPPDALPVKITGVVNMVARVTAKGEFVGAQVTSEEPPLLGLAEAVQADFDHAKFIPAFRDGDAIDAEVIMAVCYKPEADEEPQGSGLELSQPPPATPAP